MQSNATENDSLLVSRAKAGDFRSFEELVTRHEGRVYSVAMNILRHREDAEDVVQGAFLSAFEHVAGFREDASFATWITRITVNAALKVIRRRRGTRAFFNSDEGNNDSGIIPHPDYVAQWRDPHQLLERKELQRVLDEAIEELPEKQRLVFLLRDVQGMSVKETAQVLEIGEANVKVRLLRARLALREKLTRVLGDERTRVSTGHDHEDGISTPASEILRRYEAEERVSR